jgi:NAD(P)-dependent dehydrogenase (short-subunit alcohol dehydrogenase family)
VCETFRKLCSFETDSVAVNGSIQVKDNDKEASTGHGFVKTQRNDTYPFIDPLKVDLSGKTVLITGSARGLGRAEAISFAKAGASGIVLFDLLDAKPVEADLLAVAKAAGRPAPKLLSMTVDVSDENSVSNAVKAVEGTFDQLDIVVNNAGYLCYERILESDPKKWWRNWEVNVKGPYLIARGFLPMLLKGGDKTIIVLSSVGAHFTIPSGSAYETTKFAVLKLNNYLMAENGSDGILAYAVAPGGVLTDMGSGFPSEFHDRLTDTPQMVADTLVWLTKERREWLASRYVDSRWDMEELEAKKEEILRRDLLKVRMAV